MQILHLPLSSDYHISCTFMTSTKLSLAKVAVQKIVNRDILWENPWRHVWGELKVNIHTSFQPSSKVDEENFFSLLRYRVRTSQVLLYLSHLSHPLTTDNVLPPSMIRAFPSKIPCKGRRNYHGVSLRNHNLQFFSGFSSKTRVLYQKVSGKVGAS